MMEGFFFTSASFLRTLASLGGFAARSRTIDVAGLSSRRPLNAACRTLPSCVKPANSISATSFGSTQLISPARGGLAPAVKGEAERFSAPSAFNTAGALRELKPVPTRPA